MKSLNEGLFIAAVLCSTSVGGVDCYQRPASQPTRTSAPPSWEENLLSNGVRPPRRLIPKLFRIENRWEAIELIADRLLSPESATAVKMIRTIIKQFKDHGVVDVFKEYPAKDVVMAIVALGKLQRASARHDEQVKAIRSHIDPILIEELAHYSLFANAAYGWTMEAAFGRRLHMGNLQTLLKKTGIEADDVVQAAWESKTHRPAYFIVRDRKHKRLVLAIRGTLSARDVLTDLCAAAETYETGCEGLHRAHHGMLQAARGVATETAASIDDELALNPDYSLVLVGHSLGGGVAAVLGTLWESKYPDLVVYGYGSPCVGPVDARPTTCEYIVSVLGEGDPFSCLSLGHIADVSNALASLCEDDKLRTEILIRTDKSVDKMDDDDVQWCAQTMGKLRESLTGERMYPPGRTLFIKREPDNSVSLLDVARSRFSDLRLHPRMLDLSKHVPSLYESLLQEIVAK